MKQGCEEPDGGPTVNATLLDMCKRLDRLEFILGLRCSPPSGNFYPGDDLTKRGQQ
jgi:hypothetical protein